MRERRRTHGRRRADEGDADVGTVPAADLGPSPAKGVCRDVSRKTESRGMQIRRVWRPLQRRKHIEVVEDAERAASLAGAEFALEVVRIPQRERADRIVGISTSARLLLLGQRKSQNPWRILSVPSP